jgi:hypothetical protein
MKYLYPTETDSIIKGILLASRLRQHTADRLRNNDWIPELIINYFFSKIITPLNNSKCQKILQFSGIKRSWNCDMFSADRISSVRSEVTWFVRQRERKTGSNRRILFTFMFCWHKAKYFAKILPRNEYHYQTNTYKWLDDPLRCKVKVKVSRNKPRWPKGFRVG